MPWLLVHELLYKYNIWNEKSFYKVIHLTKCTTRRQAIGLYTLHNASTTFINMKVKNILSGQFKIKLVYYKLVHSFVTMVCCGNPAEKDIYIFYI